MIVPRFSYAECVDCNGVAELDGAEVGLAEGESLPMCRRCGRLRCAERAEEEIGKYRRALASGYARAARVALEEATSWLETAVGPELQHPGRAAVAH